MLDIGIGKVAARYWQLEARNATNGSGLSSGGADSLELATAQLVAEQQAQQQSSVTEDGAAVVETAEPVEESEEIPVTSPDETADPVEESEEIPIISAVETQVVSPPVTESDPEEVEAGQQEGTAESKSDLPVEELTDAALADAAAMEISEVEMQRIREERVAESFHIYKTQLEERKKGKQPTPPSCRPSTWDTSAPAVPEVERPLYWTEAMDMHLAKLVKSCVFDFDAISTAMQTLAEKDALSSNAALKKPTLLSNEACRLRWAQLDAQQWSEVSPNSTALDTQFKVCISASVLGAGHGAQPTFEALASMAAGSTPAYLKVPTAFPSVQDLVGEESDLDLD